MKHKRKTQTPCQYVNSKLSVAVNASNNKHVMWIGSDYSFIDIHIKWNANIKVSIENRKVYQICQT